MRIIESIKEAFRKLDAKLNPPIDYSKFTLHLRCGTMDQIDKSKPYHVGEIVICLDEPFLCVGTEEGFDFIPIGDTFMSGALALRAHYPKILW